MFCIILASQEVGKACSLRFTHAFAREESRDAAHGRFVVVNLSRFDTVPYCHLLGFCPVFPYNPVSYSLNYIICCDAVVFLFVVVIVPFALPSSSFFIAQTDLHDHGRPRQANCPGAGRICHQPR